MQSTSLAVDSTFGSGKTQTVHADGSQAQAQVSDQISQVSDQISQVSDQISQVSDQIAQESLDESDDEAFEGFEEVTDEENKEEVQTGRKQVNWVGPRVPIFRFWPFLLTLLTLLGPITCAGIDKGPQLGVLFDSKAAIMRGVSAAPLEKACRDSFQAEQLIKSAVVIVGYFGWKPP